MLRLKTQTFYCNYSRYFKKKKTSKNQVEEPSLYTRFLGKQYDIGVINKCVACSKVLRVRAMVRLCCLDARIAKRA